MAPSIPGLLELEDFLRGPILVISAFFVAWFLNMALTGWLAGRKGRDGGLWAVLALFTGPVALLAVLLVSRKERGPDADLDELAAATTPRVRLLSGAELEVDVEGRPAWLGGELGSRINGRPSFSVDRSATWRWSDGGPMSDEERTRLRREIPQIGKHDGWVIALAADDLQQPA